MKKYIATCVVVVFVLIVSTVLYSFRSRFIPGQIVINSEKYYRVIHVVDGDTFSINVNGREATVRMLGVNTPESVKKNSPIECYGKESFKVTHDLLLRRYVRLETSPNREDKDKYGRYLMYVYRDDGLSINEYLLRNGYAREMTVGRPYSLQRKYRELQTEAKEKRLGLWDKCNK